MRYGLLPLFALLAILGLTFLSTGCQSTSALEIGNPDAGYCPVMGDEVDVARAQRDPRFRVDYKGKRYLLCCRKCKPMFEKDPEKYINDPVPPEL